MRVIISSFYNNQRSNARPNEPLVQGKKHVITLSEYLPETLKKEGYPEGFLKYKGWGADKKNMRVRVLHRDNYACVKCGIQENLTLDHIYPKSKGGPFTLSNLQTMCVTCNGLKGNKI